MPAFTVKNIPEDLYEKLKMVAHSHRRSLNNELIHCLEVVLMPSKISVLERIEAARRVRPRIKEGTVSPEEIMEAIDRGRP